ncbi:hypothetical protein FJT64_012466 [Amphibalanus amphitrite]|uniref:Phosphatidylinositol-glycan biosynthesis class F protein n=1 Tax=Amphibalanus amphitrite TaxID=1232801 RepID=A0A6A4VFG0_AMPAM|nr:hypothetical protein FJT64_012466 [Amphibalanus amphitrite]
MLCLVSVLSDTESTVLLGAVLSLLAVYPTALTAGGSVGLISDTLLDARPHCERGRQELWAAAGALLGAWLGAFVIPLDWDRDWQVVMASLVRRGWAWLVHRYRMYELNTSVALLEPNEKVAFHTFIFCILSMMAYSTYVYLPHYTLVLLARFGLVVADTD